MLAVHLRDDVIQGLGNVGQPVHFHLLVIESVNETTVVISHLRQLRRNLSRKLYTVLQGRVRLESFALDLLQEIRSPAEELMMREFPGLDVRGGSLGTRCLEHARHEHFIVRQKWTEMTYTVDLVEAIHIQLADEARELPVWGPSETVLPSCHGRMYVRYCA